MLKKLKRFQAITDMFEIPQDIILDLPRITMLGNKQLLVENHKGIIEYCSSLVRINVDQGELIVIGRNLLLGNLQTEQILIEGVVEEIKYDA